VERKLSPCQSLSKPYLYPQPFYPFPQVLGRLYIPSPQPKSITDLAPLFFITLNTASSRRVFSFGPVILAGF
jgi:hypothetical protein